MQTKATHLAHIFSNVQRLANYEFAKIYAPNTLGAYINKSNLLRQAYTSTGF